MTNRLIIWSVVLLCSVVQVSKAQSLPELQFTHITTDNGLSTQYIRYIFQDSRGLIWICTTNGLNRYDGNSFKIFKHISENANSLPNDDVWSIAEDRIGNFWVGTQNGLCYFEPGENRFTNYYKEIGNKNSLASGRAENLLVDDSGYVWVGSHSGLQKFNPVNKTFQLIEFATGEDLVKTVNAQAVYHLFMDKKKQLWVSAGGNLFLINRIDLTYKKIIEVRYGDIGGVNSIYEDKDGEYWLCFWGKGFAKFDGEHYPAKKDFGDNSGIYFRFAEWKDVHDNSWLVIRRDIGICFYNRTSHKLVTLTHDNSIPGSFVSGGGGSIYTDKNNNLWAATGIGIDVLEPAKQFFQYHRLGEKGYQGGNNFYGTLKPVYKDGQYYWAGIWHGKGLIKLDSNWKPLKHYLAVPAGSLNGADKTVYGIYKDQEKTFWISTDNGIVNFNEKSNQFHLYSPTDLEPLAFEFRKILPLGSDKLFISTRHLGLYVFNKITRHFEKHFITNSKDSLPANDIRDITYDNAGVLWMATSSGVCSLDTATLTIKPIAGDKENGSGLLVSDDCYGIGADKKNNIWIGTANGLYKYENGGKQGTRYTTKDGLCDNAISKLLIDKHGDIWMNTSNGISLFMQKEKRFQNFNKDDGLPQNSLGGEINNDENGMLYFGDFSVVLAADPDEIPFNKTKPDVIITDATLGNQHYTIQKNGSGEKYLKTKSGNSSFTINFAVLNFNSPKQNKYFYKLEGIDKGWHETDRGVASYVNVPHGNYILKVKGGINNGLMNEEGDAIRIIINPLWFQTNWFKAFCILLLSGIVFYFVKRRISSIRKEASFKQKIAETEMQALRAQMNPHFIFNSLNSIENFIMQNEKRLASDYLNRFARLIRMILDSSRNEVVPVAKDMEALKLYIELEQLRFNNKFSYHSYVDPQLLQGDYRVPSLLIQPYVENAIVHGIAHSDKNDLQLTVTAALENDRIKYTIQDNGVGRKQATEYNLKNKPGHKSVGLQITENRIAHFNLQKQLNGAIKITDLYNDDKQPGGTKVEVLVKTV